MRRRHRHVREDAEAVLRGLLPGASYGAFARLFVAACNEAHRFAPSSWEVTLDPDMLRLNVGPVAVLSAHPREVFLCVSPIRPHPRRPFTYEHHKHEPVYPSVPVPSGTVRCTPDVVPLIRDSIRAAHLAYIGQAAARRSISAWRTAHSPAAVAVLSQAAGVSVIQPAYQDGLVEPAEIDPEGESALRDVFASREVEDAAIAHVTKVFTDDGWGVESVERDGVGYDLECRRGRATAHVEVKGLSS